MKNKIINKEKIILILILLLYAFITIYKIDSPGLNYDEVQFANIALGQIDNSFIASRIGNFPLMQMEIKNQNNLPSFFIDGHPNKNGYKIIAEKIFEYIYNNILDGC